MRNFFVFVKRLLFNIYNAWCSFGTVLKYELKAGQTFRRSSLPRLKKAQKKEVKEFYRKYGFKRMSTRWHRIYSGIHGSYSKYYLPDSEFYGHIEMAINRWDFHTLQDKNLLDKLVTGISKPETLLKNINGLYYFKNRLVDKVDAIQLLLDIPHDKVILKPSLDSGGGKNVRLLSKQSSVFSINGLNEIFEEYQKDFLVQKVLEQSDFMLQFNPTSLNTIRMITFLKNSGPEWLYSSLRIGGKDSFTDNTNDGGLYCNVEMDGSLVDNLLDGNFKKHKKTGIGASVLGKKIPDFKQIVEKIKNVHKELPYFRLISWDIAVNSLNEPVLIEFNVFGQGIAGQAVKGPLAGKFTEELLSLYVNSK